MSVVFLTACAANSHTPSAPPTASTPPAQHPSAPPAALPQHVPMTMVKKDAQDECVTRDANQNILLALCLGDTNQYWTMRQGQVLNQNDCLDVKGAATAGASLVATPCSNSNTQQWAYVAGDLQLGSTQLCASGASAALEAPLVLAACKSDSADQVMLLNHTDPNGTTGFTVSTTADANQCLSLPSNANDITVQACDGGAGQLWTFDQFALTADPNVCVTAGGSLGVGPCSADPNTQFTLQDGALTTATLPAQCAAQNAGAVTLGACNAPPAWVWGPTQ